MGEDKITKGSYSHREPKSRLTKEDGSRESLQSDMITMKEKFGKLLLGEDMSGGGKGVSSALALSNAITNLAASVFGEQRKLEPMQPERKARWRKEVDWLLSVTDHIVELIPKIQTANDGAQIEVMTTCQRTDLHMNIPALRKLDAMLMEYLDNFRDQKDFWYVKRTEEESENGNAQRNEDKWWLPTVKVGPEGLSEVSRRWLQFQKESVNQVLKAAMAINAQVISEMEIPENYIETLPKNGRASLGDAIYKSITVEWFDPEQFISATLDLSTEHKIVDIKNRIEASIVIWKRKMHNKDGKSSWGSAVSLEKREVFEERAETVLLLLKHRFPGIPQSSLDITKIQYNKDVGQAILESYSRILESLAHTIMSQIEDVLYADSVARDPSLEDSNARRRSSSTEVKIPNSEEEIEKLNYMETPGSMTLSDFMGWHVEQDPDARKLDYNNNNNALGDSSEDPPPLSLEDALTITKLGENVNVSSKRISYFKSLGGLNSPTAARY